ncbi:hypothetical protein FH972_018062 [Carpinus fangiana]|uniref:Uncharacterized protein n=1 Tax=Carpinus fangiana TaxID=176857 RepID=A0A5N6RMY5_9ROSI|nr:hypothetical protein FH972_018062 [Carpinus fangiana]
MTDAQGKAKHSLQEPSSWTRWMLVLPSFWPESWSGGGEGQRQCAPAAGWCSKACSTFMVFLHSGCSKETAFGFSMSLLETSRSRLRFHFHFPPFFPLPPKPSSLPPQVRHPPQATTAAAEGQPDSSTPPPEDESAAHRTKSGYPDERPAPPTPPPAT